MARVAGACGAQAAGPGEGDGEPRQMERGHLLGACQQFQQADTYHRGLITAAAFSKALDALGLRYGQKEVEDIMEYCTVTSDGYVHYKELLRLLMPATPRGGRCTAKGAIFPDEGPPRRAGDPGSSAEELRWLYARWERGHLSSEGLRAELQGAGAAVTSELDRLLSSHGASRAMSYREMMHALQIDKNDGRRARNPQGVPGGDVPTLCRAGHRAAGHSPPMQPVQAGSAHTGCASSDAGMSLRQAVCAFVDGQMPAHSFRQQLARYGAPMTDSLHRLIRTHECDNSVRFQDFARVLLLQDKREQLGDPDASDFVGGSGAATPSGSGAPTPSTGRRMFSAPLSDLASPHSQPGPQPYAVGGAWSDDGRSDVSYISGFATVQLPNGATPAVQPPFATQEELRDPGKQQQPPPLPQHRPPMTSRAQLHSGDIIGWKKGYPQAELLVSQPDRRLRRGSSTGAISKPRGGSFLHWTSGQDEDVRQHEEPEEPRFGKRLSTKAPPAGERAPFGRQTDAAPARPRQFAISKPFGTDQDLRLQRPEDAGTDEFRAAVRSARRVH